MKEINLSEYEQFGKFWINCSHDDRSFSFTLQAESPKVIFNCCKNCYNRLWEMFVRDLTEIRVKATME